jgi:hypothetical protein
MKIPPVRTSPRSRSSQIHKSQKELLLVATVAFVATVTSIAAGADAKKPNILVIFGDDIGIWKTDFSNPQQAAYQAAYPALKIPMEVRFFVAATEYLGWDPDSRTILSERLFRRPTSPLPQLARPPKFVVGTWKLRSAGEKTTLITLG